MTVTNPSTLNSASGLMFDIMLWSFQSAGQHDRYNMCLTFLTYFETICTLYTAQVLVLPRQKRFSLFTWRCSARRIGHVNMSFAMSCFAQSALCIPILGNISREKDLLLEITAIAEIGTNEVRGLRVRGMPSAYNLPSQVSKHPVTLSLAVSGSISRLCNQL